MNTIFKKLYLSIPFTIILSLILYLSYPILYTGTLSRLSLEVFSMNISLLISAVLLALAYYFRFRSKNTKPILNTVLLSLFSLSIGIVFLNISKLPLECRTGLWILSLIVISYYFKDMIVNIFLTIAFTFYIASNLSILSSINLLLFPSSFSYLPFLTASIILLFISNIPFISKNYPKFCLTYKVFSLFIILQNLLLIFVNTTFGIGEDFLPTTLNTSHNPPSLLVLSIVPTLLALLSFTSYVLNKNRLSFYLKLEICLSIMLSIVMIFVINFSDTYLSLIILGLYFAILSMIIYYLAFFFKSPYILLAMNTIVLNCILNLILLFKISELPIIIPTISYIVFAIVLNLPFKKLSSN